MKNSISAGAAFVIRVESSVADLITSYADVFTVHTKKAQGAKLARLSSGIGHL